MRLLLSIFLFCSISIICVGQPGISNPGFEDNRGPENVPNSWFVCDSSSTPDILPGSFDVTLKPFEGESYVGLISRKIGNVETICQKLDSSFMANKCYRFNLKLAQSDNYSDYNIPIGLKIWVSSGACGKEQLVFYEKRIDYIEWKNRIIEFVAVKDMNYITIIPVWAPGIYFPYKGNVLIDDISPIIECNRT